jgi:hypothetical protein
MNADGKMLHVRALKDGYSHVMQAYKRSSSVNNLQTSLKIGWYVIGGQYKTMVPHTNKAKTQ